MGYQANISTTNFPKQGVVGHKVRLAFHFDTNNSVSGTVVRDDVEAPGRIIFRVDEGPHEGKFVLGIECQYTLDMRVKP